MYKGPEARKNIPLIPQCFDNFSTISFLFCDRKQCHGQMIGQDCLELLKAVAHKSCFLCLKWLSSLNMHSHFKM